MTRWSDEENCISLPTLYMRKVDDVRRTLGKMRENNVRTEEFGEYLRPVIRLCKKSVNSRIGAVDYFIQRHDFKHIAVDHYDIEFAVRQLRENVDQLDSLTEKLAQIVTLNVKKPSGHLGMLAPLLLIFVMSGKRVNVKSMNLFLRFA